MEPRLSVLIDETKEKFGLENYDLHNYEFSRTVDLFQNTNYTLSMEWFPNHTVEVYGVEYNPEGAAVIEVDLTNHKVKSVIFVGEKSFSNHCTFADFNTGEVIDWVQGETGLIYNKQFQLIEAREGSFNFKGCLNGIDVSPVGLIELKYDHNGRLTFFSVNGHFPEEESKVEENYTLTLEKIEPYKRKQLKLIDFPSSEYKRLLEIYAVEEIYIKNDLSETYPYEVSIDGKKRIKIEEEISWDTVLTKPFERQEIDILEEISEKQAFAGEPHPDLSPISELEKEKCMNAVKDFLRQQYPYDSGKWILKELSRDKGYIHAILCGCKKKSCVLQRKLLIIIDGKNLEAVNYLDNKVMLETFDQYRVPERIIISEEEAYGKLKECFELKPTYVYDHVRKQYILCGKLDCSYGINASNGEMIALDNM